MWKLRNHIIFISFSYYFHILGSETRAQAPKRRHGARAGPGPPPLWGLGPGEAPAVFLYLAVSPGVSTEPEAKTRFSQKYKNNMNKI